MKIVVKTLKGEIMNIDCEPVETIADLKGKIKDLKGFEVDTQKLVFKGKATANEDSLEKVGVKENDFLVVMTVVKKPEPKVEVKTEEKPVKEGEKVEGEVKPVTTTNTEVKGQSQPANEEIEAQIKELMDMGFTREKCQQALRAAYNNSDRAVEYLLNGIPERPQQPVHSGGGLGDSNANMIQLLRNNPQFAQIRDIIRGNPAALQPILQQIAQNSPQLYDLIAQNPEAFERMIMDDDEEGDSSVPHQPQQPPPGSIMITPEQREAIDRLSALGFSKIEAAQAYIACDNNEELAANLLFDRLANGDIEMGDQVNEGGNNGGNGNNGDGSGNQEGDDDDDNLFN